jgi:protein-disulfide isomerase/uncharacterized membrane protein
MRKSIVLQVVAVVLAGVAGFFSFELLAKHLTGSTNIAVLDAACGPEEPDAGTASCDEVLQSKYGVWPFIEEGDPEDQRRTPVALFGMMYYGVLIVWLVGVGAPCYERRWIHVIPLGINLAGLASSVFFTALMFTEMEFWCPLCLVTHVLNLLLFVCVVLLWPGRPKEPIAEPVTDPEAIQRRAFEPPADACQESADSKEETATAEEPGPIPRTAPLASPLSSVPARRHHPTGRHVLVTLIAMWLVWFGQSMFYMAAENKKAAKGLDRCLAQINEFKGNPEWLVDDWQRGKKHKFELREDDAIRGGIEGQKKVRCVVFSDFECPWCSKLARILEEEVQPLFGGNLALVYKHYPLNHECNGKVKGKPHPHSCYGAKLAEGARMQHGGDGFWEAHDYLYANRKRLGKLTTEEFAEALKLDHEQLLEDMKSEEAAKRVWEDINLGAASGVKATPTLYLSGKRVGKFAIAEMSFWDIIADRYWRAIGKPRPEDTLLKNVEAARAKAKAEAKKKREESRKSKG